MEMKAMKEELCELDDELLWKWWSKDKIDMQNIRVELIDILHFSPIDLIIFLISFLRSSLKSGTGNLINCPSICGFKPKSDFLIAASTKGTLFTSHT